MPTEPKATLLLPVELQVRELDPKLLLACMAARRGYASLIGPRREMHFYIPFFKNAIYLSKSMTSGSVNVFKWLRELGHNIVAWDEEALVHLPPEHYFKRRFNDETLKYVSHLFAWGEDNVDLWNQYPRMPASLQVHITGNPRGDLLRPEVRAIYQQDAQALQAKFGDFILVNTNFNPVNMYFAEGNLLVASETNGGQPALSRRARGMGMSLAYAQGYDAHKRAIFEDFQKLIPKLDQAFPRFNIIVRPHPAENPQVYHRIAERCRRVRVTNEGNVVPWLMASRAMVHNGCTTGVEAFLLDVPTFSYRATAHDGYDFDFHHLPNLISHECFTYDELQAALGKALEEEGTDPGEDKRALMRHYLAAQSGPLACERMLDVLDRIVAVRPGDNKPTMRKRLDGYYRSYKRRFKKRFRGLKSEMSHNRGGFLRHRYPAISPTTMRERMQSIQTALNMSETLKLTKVHRKFFRISM